jgi:hypothetical protein
MSIILRKAQLFVHVKSQASFIINRTLFVHHRDPNHRQCVPCAGFLFKNDTNNLPLRLFLVLMSSIQALQHRKRPLGGMASYLSDPASVLATNPDKLTLVNKPSPNPSGSKRQSLSSTDLQHYDNYDSPRISKSTTTTKSIMRPPVEWPPNTTLQRRLSAVQDPSPTNSGKNLKQVPLQLRPSLSTSAASPSHNRLKPSLKSNFGAPYYAQTIEPGIRYHDDRSKQAALIKKAAKHRSLPVHMPNTSFKRVINKAIDLRPVVNKQPLHRRARPEGGFISVSTLKKKICRQSMMFPFDSNTARLF